VASGQSKEGNNKIAIFLLEVGKSVL
jgi:hypothetical protein